MKTKSLYNWVLLTGICLVTPFSSVLAAEGVPDLTKGGKPIPIKKSKNGKLLVGNLGPTGLRGWVYHNRSDTSQSRQILVTAVDPGSPSVGVLKAGDVILGASGIKKDPGMFTVDAIANKKEPLISFKRLK